MALSDEEIERKIEKTVYKLEKYYKIYNVFYKLKKRTEKCKELIVKNFLTSLIIYTIVLYFIFRCL